MKDVFVADPLRILASRAGKRRFGVWNNAHVNICTSGRFGGQDLAFNPAATDALLPPGDVDPARVEQNFDDGARPEALPACADGSVLALGFGICVHKVNPPVIWHGGNS